MACLTLVAPSGMSAEDRGAWVAVAKATLSGIPADLLALGCKKARESCRFASEIVPAIFDEVGSTWESRKLRAEREDARLRMVKTPRIEAPPPQYVDSAEMRKLIRSIGR